MRVTLFADAFDVAGSPVSTTWPEFVAAIEAGLSETATDKRNLPAFGAYELNGPRENASVVSFSALVFDLDALGGPDGLEAFIGRVADADVMALVYETPGSTEEAPRARLVLPLDGALSPASFRAARAAVAESLGLEPDPVTHDPMRLAFVGRLAGTPPRRLWTFDGDLTPADGWTATATPEALSVAGEWPSERRAPDDLVAELAEALTPAWHRGERESWWLPFCGWARGKLWTRADIEAVVEALPESDGGSHPNEHFSAPAKLDRVSALTGPGIARDALGYDFDAVDRVVGRHPSAAPFAPAPAFGFPAAAQGGPVPQAELLPTVVQRDDRYWLRKLYSDTYYGALREKDLRLLIDRTHGDAFPHRSAKSGEIIPTATFMARPGVGEIALEIVADFTATGNTWNGATRTMHLGYDLTLTRPERDAAVEAWLGALFGADGVDEAMQWVAACRQDRLRELAVALAIVGSPGCGKTVFFRGLAWLWGVDFVELGHVVDRFNSVICRCPFWVDDECKTLRKGDLTSEEFRQLIQRGIHDYEPKGLERRTLRGYARFGLTANEASDLRFGAVYGASAVQAVADRLAIYNVPDDSKAREALDRLRLPGTDRIDLGRLAGHFAWVMDSVTPRVGRFLGARADNSAGVAAALHSVVHGYPELFEWLADRLASAADKAPGAALHVVAASGRVYVSPARVLDALAFNTHAKHSLGRIQDALKPFRLGAPTVLYLDGRGENAKATRFWELDRQLLVKALPETAPGD